MDNGQKPIQTEPEEVLKLMRDPDGSIAMSTKLIPPMLCWYLIQIIVNMVIKAQPQSKVIPSSQLPTGGLRRFMRGGFRGGPKR